tara:strand:- start:1490 stop:1648 length:159 start_codon:yes stop_codon:yes gene_type:complete
MSGKKRIPMTMGRRIEKLFRLGPKGFAVQGGKEISMYSALRQMRKDMQKKGR